MVLLKYFNVDSENFKTSTSTIIDPFSQEKQFEKRELTTHFDFSFSKLHLTILFQNPPFLHLPSRVIISQAS